MERPWLWMKIHITTSSVHWVGIYLWNQAESWVMRMVTVRWQWDDPKTLALLIGADMALFAAWKVHLGALPELLWFCNAASLVLVPALWFELSPLVGMVLLLRVALGEPGHLYAFAVTRDVEWVSVLANLPPLLAAWWYLRHRGLPRHTALWAFAFVALALLLSRLFTPADLNVNMVFRRHGLLARPFPGLWSYRVSLAVLIGALLMAGEWLLSYWLRPSEGFAAAAPSKEIAR